MPLLSVTYRFLNAFAALICSSIARRNWIYQPTGTKPTTFPLKIVKWFIWSPSRPVCKKLKQQFRIKWLTISQFRISSWNHHSIKLRSQGFSFSLLLFIWKILFFHFQKLNFINKRFSKTQLMNKRWNKQRQLSKKKGKFREISQLLVRSSWRILRACRIGQKTRMHNWWDSACFTLLECFTFKGWCFKTTFSLCTNASFLSRR